MLARGVTSRRGVFDPEAVVDPDAFFDQLASLRSPPPVNGQAAVAAMQHA